MLNNRKTMIGMVALGLWLIQRAVLPDLLTDKIEEIALGLIATWTGVSLRLAIRKAQVRT